MNDVAEKFDILPSANLLVFMNGHLESVRSFSGDIVMTSLAEAYEHHPELLKKTECLASKNDELRGAFVYVPDNVCVEEPVHLVFIEDAINEKSMTINYCNIVIANPLSKITVVEYYNRRVDTAYVTNARNEFLLEAGAEVNHYKVQDANALNRSIGDAHIKQRQDSIFRSFIFALGSDLSRHNCHVELRGKNAHCDLKGFAMARGRERVEIHTRVDHYVPHCTSLEKFKSVADDEGRAIFNGSVVVHADAQKTLSQQSSQNLLLSSCAEIGVKPELEIYADDVKCQHGATIGEIDEAALFYLRSRGIAANDARAILIKAFTDDSINHVALLSLQHYLKKMVPVALQGESVL